MKNLAIHIIQISDHKLPAPLCFSAVFFDTQTGEFGEELFVKIDPASCRSAGLEVSPEELRRWIGKQQDIDLISDEMKVSLRLAVNMLSGFAFMDSQRMVLESYEKRLQEQGFENWKEISRFLCQGDAKAYYDSEIMPESYAYQVVNNMEWQSSRDAKFWQRLNRLWFVPLYCLTIPLQWLFRGKVGFNTTSKTAEIISRMTGLK